ncbi:MAG: uracil phosphoribosyltransferase, partial [Bdellovibrionales bacterium]|nr:uracil phosphoribosyltransferase [Bdellovibrionales bacterium]
LLARLCQPETTQPLINQLVELLYSDLVKIVLEQEFPKVKIKVPTRMTAKHPGQLLEAEVIKRNQTAVTVNLARAGTYPSHICFNTLNFILNPEGVRQDHILASRMTDLSHKVTGTDLGGAKIGGGIDNSIVIFPDPMGATGGTISSALQHYKQSVAGRAQKFIALHLIITPEYIARMTKDHPDLQIYSVRLDRGLSTPQALSSIPGQWIDQEKGLDENQYIVPGGGGFGEILNNSYV